MTRTQPQASTPYGDWDMAPAEGTDHSMVEVAQTRAAQEVQGKMVIAKRFPRDETATFARIMRSCQRRSLAEQALYAYPRGNTTVTGPSIRLAEVLARAWGNLDFGIVELDQQQGKSIIMAYAWDMETNTQQTKIFTVPHVRHTRSGVTVLTDPRDIYEMTANQGARRLRACILGIIPGDMIEAATQECEKTLAGTTGEPLIDRIRKMVAAFQDYGVSQAMIEKRIGHRVDTVSESELVGLRKIFLSLRDNMANRDDFFPPEPPPTGSRTEALVQRLNGKANGKPIPFDPNDVPPEPATDAEGSQLPEDEAAERAAQAEPPPPAREQIKNIRNEIKVYCLELTGGDREAAKQLLEGISRTAFKRDDNLLKHTDAEAVLVHGHLKRMVLEYRQKNRPRQPGDEDDGNTLGL